MTKQVIDRIRSGGSTWQTASRSGVGLHLDDFLTFRFSLITTLFDRAVSRSDANEEVSVPEWRVMALLHKYAPIAAHDIAGVSLMHKGQLSRAIAALIERGYVTRTPDANHGRRQYVALSKEGRTVFARRFRHAQKAQAALLHVLSEEERAQLEVMLNKLTLAAADNLDNLMKEQGRK